MTPIEATPREDGSDVFVSDEIVRIPRSVRFQTEELCRRPESEDPTPVRAFLLASDETGDVPGSTVFTPNQSRPATLAAAGEYQGQSADLPSQIGRYRRLKR